MTLSNQSTKAVAQGNGATTVWPFDFLVPAETDLIVTIVTLASGNEEVLAPSVFTVTGIGNPIGGSVTYPLSGPPLSTLFDIVIERFVPDVQETDLVNQGGAYPQDIEDALDYLTMITQQLQDQVDRAVVFSVADTVEGTLPVASARANLIMGFDVNGNPIAVAEIDPSVQVSAAMIPVVTAPTTADALIALGLPGSLLNILIPAGTIWDFTLPTAPTGFIFPTGQACTSTYPVYRAALIAAGSPYGTNGTDPLVPDLRSAVIAGQSTMGGAGDNGLLTGATVLGAFLGVQSKTLITGNLPPYTPAGTVPITDPGHIHTSDAFLLHAGSNSAISNSSPGGTWASNPPAVTIGSDTTGITASFTGTAQGGTSTPFSIVQPTLVCTKILKVH